ncbi:MAG: hypothetical protein PF636_07795 [Actinomycetota bacterium]|nr:hypothetical protein [Actinomycetota bacterium]
MERHSECKWSGDCPFFSDPRGFSPDMGKRLMKRYCRNDYHACARYIGRTALGTGNIPHDMLPGDFERLESLLGSLLATAR